MDSRTSTCIYSRTSWETGTLAPHNPNHNIPVIHTDRGGQITYHGPGASIFYVLLNLKNRKQGLKGLVTTLEQAVSNFLATINIHAYIKPNAPGVYTDAGKIAFIGLRELSWLYLSWHKF